MERGNQGTKRTMQDRPSVDSSPLLVALGLSPSGEISPTHFGDSAQVLLARIDGGGVEILETKPNPVKSVKEERHGDPAKLGKAAELLKDVRVVVSGKKSPNFVKLRGEKGKWPMTAQGDPRTFLEWLAAHREEVETWFAQPENLVYQVDPE